MVGIIKNVLLFLYRSNFKTILIARQSVDRDNIIYGRSRYYLTRSASPSIGFRSCYFLVFNRAGRKPRVYGVYGVYDVYNL